MNKLLLLLSILCNSLLSSAQLFEKINPQNVEIVRDQWGVPHIYGHTDAEAGYGLAWACSEDAFKENQELLIIGKQMKGKQDGIEGAKADYFANVIQARKLVDKEMKELPEDFLRYIDGYIQGVNRYAELHEEDVLLDGLFPVQVEDILTTYVVVMSFLTESSSALDKIYNGKFDDKETIGLGSNAFAVNSTKTTDKSTFLCINPHLEMLGSFSFYEAHIVSNEGLNMHGALFYGGTSIYMGNNEHLGWGMTWNYFDQGDVYKLKMHPKKKLTYSLDDTWLELEPNKFKLNVRIGKKFSIAVKKKSYWSELGPVLKSKKSNDYYAFKFPAFYTIKAPLQWYRMNKAKNLSEFKAALELFGVAMFNIVYADKDDNIYYVSYGEVPYREDTIVSKALIDGSKTKHVWTRLHTLKELPHNENPASGFVFNTNNTPYHSDAIFRKSYKESSKKYLDLRPNNNNRALRLLSLLTTKEKIDFETFQSFKFDNSYDQNTYLVKELDFLFTANPKSYPEISDMLLKMQEWDFEADSMDVSAALLMVTIDYIFKEKGYSDRQFITDIDINEKDMITATKMAKAWFLKHYGTIEIPLGKIFKAKKGDKIVTAPGFPDALAANYGEQNDSLYILKYGDTYTHFVKFNRNGVEEMRTQVPFGLSYDEQSDYYFNQSDLFRKQETKLMTLDKETIYKNSKKIYHPK